MRVEQQQLIGGATARVYTITQGLAEANPSAVTGQILYLDTPIYVLIDCGATHCFIAKSLLERLKLQPVRIA